ncbi:SCO family protein [Rummeliibacillus sp. G93]|uniref:SCO family protein n=1 Tax=Rummeliibacillus sp. G93 TaxID=2939494 RepID=UPI00201BCD29|nr:SCO family protein [Rummeliibacillus sp. G93]UQW98020.1 SCO family protein [Rummeliibacillus sp. G93]
MKKRVIIMCGLLFGAILVYIFWPKAAELPKLHKIENPELQTIDGKEFSFSNSKPKLITFYYTNCPDVCPMTMLDLKELQGVLKEKDVKETEYDVVLITMDPEVDTSRRIKQYASHFEPIPANWIFIRGTLENTRKTINDFNFAYKKDEEGTIAHSTTMYLADTANQIRAYHTMNTGQKAVNIEQLAENIYLLIKEN